MSESLMVLLIVFLTGTVGLTLGAILGLAFKKT